MEIRPRLSLKEIGKTALRTVLAAAVAYGLPASISADGDVVLKNTATSPSGRLEVTAQCGEPHEYAGSQLGQHIDINIRENYQEKFPNGHWADIVDEVTGQRNIFMYQGESSIPNGASLHSFIAPIRGNSGLMWFEQNRQYTIRTWTGDAYTISIPQLDKVIDTVSVRTPICSKPNTNTISRTYPQCGATVGLEAYNPRHTIMVNEIYHSDGQRTYEVSRNLGPLPNQCGNP